MNQKRTRRHAMKHETDNGGDALDICKRMAGAGVLLMTLTPIALVISVLWVSCTQA